MSKIRILPEDVSNRIAAGEVIARPASVVKELVENSLDAGASHIAVHAQRGGRSLIRVIDDGSGMDSEDALLCIEAHATSKIQTAADVESIKSFGFRGEAIPSISSVSHFGLITKQRDTPVGTEVIVDGGVVKNVSEAGCAVGTSITVKKIFYNVPARRKFIRTDNTENFHITETILLSALANPKVGFQLTIDNKPVISVQADSDQRTRATMLLGKDMLNSMMLLDYEEKDIHIHGFIARPGLSRTSRRDQRTFVNCRPVESNTVYYAIRAAYHTLVMKGRYPPVLLFINLPPEVVDINVHPTKREIRFRNGKTVGQIITQGMIRALTGIVQNIHTIPGSTVCSPNLQTRKKPAPQIIAPEIPLFDKPVPALQSQRVDAALVKQISKDKPSEKTIESNQNDSVQPIQNKTDHELPGYSHAASGTSVSAAGKDEILTLKLLGNLSNLFLLAEGKEGLVLIDQHAAHERILFEKVLNEMKKKDGTSQGLLLPITIDFSNADAKILRDSIDNLVKLGFEMENFGGNTFIISAVPAHFPQKNITGMLHDIIDELANSPQSPKRADEDSIAKIACKAAVKAHDRLSDSEMKHLLKELHSMELPYTCPHGRPTMINISFKELEKRFGRRN